MDPPAFEDRHPVLDPQQRLVGRGWPAGTPPSRRHVDGGEQFGEGGCLGLRGVPVPRRKQGSSRGSPSRAPGPAFAKNSAGPDARRRLRRRPETSLLPHDSQRFCSTFVLCPATRRSESIPRTPPPGLFRHRRPPSSLRNGLRSRADAVQRRAAEWTATSMIGVDLDRFVALIGRGPVPRRRDDSVAPRPQCQGRHRRLVADARERRLVDVVTRQPARRIRARWCWS